MGGYRLRADSHAINSGKVIAESGGKDFLGTHVPTCGGVDLGALESDACAGSAP